jgi:hypothetical protein
MPKTTEELMQEANLAVNNANTTVQLADTNSYKDDTNTTSTNKQPKGFIAINAGVGKEKTEFTRGLLGQIFTNKPATRTSQTFKEVEMYSPVSAATDTKAVAELATSDCYQTSGYKTVKHLLYPAREAFISETVADSVLISEKGTVGNIESLYAKHSRSATYALSRKIQAKLYSNNNAVNGKSAGEIVGIKNLMTKIDTATGTPTASGTEGYYFNNLSYTATNTSNAVQSILATHSNRTTEQQVTKAILIVPFATGVLFKKYFKDQSDTAPIATYNIDAVKDGANIDPFGKGTAYSMFADMGDKYQILNDLWIVESKDCTAKECTYLPIEINGIPALTNEYLLPEIVNTVVLYNGDTTKSILIESGITQLEPNSSLPCNSFAIKKEWYGYLYFQGAMLGRVWTNITTLSSSALPSTARDIPTFTGTINPYA